MVIKIVLRLVSMALLSIVTTVEAGFLALALAVLLPE